MTTDFDIAPRRLGTGSIKWESVEIDGGHDQADRDHNVRARQGVIPMWLADMDFASPKPVLDALKSRLEHGVLGYTDPGEPYFQSIVRWQRRRNRWDIQPASILTVTGVMQGMSLAIQTFTSRGDGVIIQPPVFRPFSTVIEANHRQLLANPLLLKGERYEMNFDELSRIASAKDARMMILCSPHNPVGRVWSPGELRRVASICREHDLILFSDEIHSDLIYPWARFTTVAVAQPSIAERLIVGTGPSKTFNLPGLRTALLILPNADLRQRLWNSLGQLNETFGFNLMGSTALRAAYEEGEPWLRDLIAYLQGNLEYLDSFLRTHLPQIRLVPPESLYLAWLDCRSVPPPPAGLQRLLYEEAGVYLESGDTYGAEGDGFLRMTIACPRATLEEALNRMHAALTR